MRRTFRERNPIPLGVGGLVVIGVGVLLAFNLSSFGGGTSYSAAFSEAAGLKTGEEVRIAGVKVGKVTGVDLEDDHVRVDFRVDEGVRFGTLTRAEIKIKTILGAHYLALRPAGRGRQSSDRQIPLSRTHAPYQVVPALQDLSRQVEQIDTAQLARAFDVLSVTFADSPADVRASLRGLQRLSRSIASRDDQLSELLGRSRNVTDLLAERRGDLRRLVADGDRLLVEIQARRAVIHQLLVNTVSLAEQINGLIRDNNARLGPTLQNLRQVIDVLENNQANLQKALQLFVPLFNELTDATGGGRWFDNYVQNLVPLPTSIRPPESSAGGDAAPGTDPLLPFLD